MHEENYKYILMDNCDNSIEDRITIDHLQAVMETLLSNTGARTQHAFRMSRLDCLSIKEISIKMNISPRTVENHISTALTALRPMLKTARRGAD
jgi:RNA polymerase sigma-70 factor (ECF subfamily)